MIVAAGDSAGSDMTNAAKIATGQSAAACKSEIPLASVDAAFHIALVQPSRLDSMDSPITRGSDFDNPGFSL